MALHQGDDSLSTSLTLFKSCYSCEIDFTFGNQILKHAFFYTQDMDYCYQVCRYCALSAHIFCNCTLTSVNEKCLACKLQRSIASSEARILRLFGGVPLLLENVTYHFLLYHFFRLTHEHHDLGHFFIKHCCILCHHWLQSFRPQCYTDK